MNESNKNKIVQKMVERLNRSTYEDVKNETFIDGKLFIETVDEYGWYRPGYEGIGYPKKISSITTCYLDENSPICIGYENKSSDCQNEYSVDGFYNEEIDTTNTKNYSDVIDVFAKELNDGVDEFGEYRDLNIIDIGGKPLYVYSDDLVLNAALWKNVRRFKYIYIRIFNQTEKFLMYKYYFVSTSLIDKDFDIAAFDYKSNGLLHRIEVYARRFTMKMRLSYNNAVIYNRIGDVYKDDNDNYIHIKTYKSFIIYNKTDSTKKYNIKMDIYCTYADELGQKIYSTKVSVENYCNLDQKNIKEDQVRTVERYKLEEKSDLSFKDYINFLLKKIKNLYANNKLDTIGVMEEKDTFTGNTEESKDIRKFDKYINNIIEIGDDEANKIFSMDSISTHTTKEKFYYIYDILDDDDEDDDDDDEDDED